MQNCPTCGSKTLEELKDGDVTGVGPETAVAIWVGREVNPGDYHALVTALVVNGIDLLVP